MNFIKKIFNRNVKSKDACEKKEPYFKIECNENEVDVILIINIHYAQEIARYLNYYSEEIKNANLELTNFIKINIKANINENSLNFNINYADK